MAVAGTRLVSLRRAAVSEIKGRIGGISGMHVDEREVDEVRKFLWPDETVELTIKQRKLRPGGSLITPTSFVATNKRLIIVNRTRLGIRKDFEVIPYRYITAVKLQHGIMSCSVLIRVSSVESGDTGGQAEAIGGIRPREADTLVHYLNKKIMESHHAPADERQKAPAKEVQQSSKFCTECGARNHVLAKFCAACGASSAVEV